VPSRSSPPAVCSCTGDAVAADVMSAGRQNRKRFGMPVYISDVTEVVEPIDDSFDEDDTTEKLQSLRSNLADEIEEIEQLTDALFGWLTEAANRVSEIDDVLDKRDADKRDAAKDDDEDESEANQPEATA
jgi:hypothetical protein